MREFLSSLIVGAVTVVLLPSKSPPAPIEPAAPVGSDALTNKTPDGPLSTPSGVSSDIDQPPQAVSQLSPTSRNLPAEPAPPPADEQPDQILVIDFARRLTDEQFADLQKWLRAGKTLQEWVDQHPDRALKQEAQAPPTVAEQMYAEDSRLIASIREPRTLDPRICQAAQEQAEHLARINYWYTSGGNAHESGNGTPSTRAARYGFYGDVSENFAGNSDDAPAAFGQWQRSPGHARTLYGNYDRCGFGMAQSKTTGVKYWIAVYGREGSAAPKLVAATRPQPVRYYPAKQAKYYYGGSCSGPGCGSSGGGLFGGRFRRR